MKTETTLSLLAATREQWDREARLMNILYASTVMRMFNPEQTEIVISKDDLLATARGFHVRQEVITDGDGNTSYKITLTPPNTEGSN